MSSVCNEGGNILIFSANEKYPFKYEDFFINFYSEPLGITDLSVVRLCEHKPSKKSIAIKIVDMSRLKQEAKNFRLLSECTEIIDFYGLCIYNHQALICMELMSHSLEDFYKNIHKFTDEFPEEFLGNITVPIINALCYCESKSIIHRDVKPRNILINFQGHIKLGDFGVSRTFADSSIRSSHGTYAYWPPERFDIETLSYDGRSDVWSFGITLLECVANRLPYLDGPIIGGESFVVIQHAIKHMDPNNLIERYLKYRYNVHCIEFISHCLSPIQSRPTVEILKTDSFYEINNNNGSQHFYMACWKYYWSYSNKVNHVCFHCKTKLDGNQRFYQCLTCDTLDFCDTCFVQHPLDHKIWRFMDRNMEIPSYKDIKTPLNELGDINCCICKENMYEYGFNCLQCNSLFVCKHCEHTGAHSEHVLIRIKLKQVTNNASLIYEKTNPTYDNVALDEVPAPIDSRRSTGLDEDHDSYLIDPEQLNKRKKLGKGSFGEVFLATWVKSNGQNIDVAVKMLHQAQAVTEALQEIRNMQKLKNVNVVRLFGITIDPIQVVFEICEGGSLHDRLKSLEKPTLLVSQILIYARQLCDGMEYLESKQCVHRDLAARNVLLSKNEEIIKISDFGLTRFLKKDQIYYLMKSEHGIPYRWYPPEAIWHKKFSHKSDVWSYGITLWEMFTYGSLPWDGRTMFQILSDMGENKKLEKPKRTDQDVYDIMSSCWNLEKDQRPSFSKIKSELENKEFAVGKCLVAQTKNLVENTLGIDKEDEVIILYEIQPKLWFGQNTKTREFGQIHTERIKRISDASIVKEQVVTSVCNMDEENKISINDTHSYEIPKKSYKKVERVRVEATSLGRTNLLIQVDNICIVMYPRTEDIEELLKRNRIDCCIGCPTADVMLQLNNHFPQIEWVTWDMDFINILIQNKIHPNRIHFTENYVAKKVIIQGLEFKMYKNNRGYIIKGPTSRILYLWAQEKNNKELSDEIKKQLKRLRPFQAAFFCVNSLRNPDEIKTIFDLVKAQKNVLMFVKDRPLDDEINFVQTLISKGIKQEDLIVLEKSHDYQQDFFKYKARKNFLYYLKIWRKDSNESYHPLSTSIDTLSTL